MAELLQARTMAPGGAVAVVWDGFQLTIRDNETLAAADEVALTAADKEHRVGEPLPSADIVKLH